MVFSGNHPFLFFPTDDRHDTFTTSIMSLISSRSHWVKPTPSLLSLHPPTHISSHPLPQVAVSVSDFGQKEKKNYYSPLGLCNCWNDEMAPELSDRPFSIAIEREQSRPSVGIQLHHILEIPNYTRSGRDVMSCILLTPFLCFRDHVVFCTVTSSICQTEKRKKKLVSGRPSRWIIATRDGLWDEEEIGMNGKDVRTFDFFGQSLPELSHEKVVSLAGCGKRD